MQREFAATDASRTTSNTRSRPLRGVGLFAPLSVVDQKEADYTSARKQIAKSSLEILEIPVDAVERTIEEVVFYLAGEIDTPPEALVVFDRTAAGYDVGELTRRFVYHFPESKIVVVGATDAGYEESDLLNWPSAHFLVTVPALGKLLAVLSEDSGNSAELPDGVIRNGRLYEHQEKLTEVMMSYARTEVEGQEYSDIQLNTPIAPKELPEHESVAHILSRQRTTGKVMLIVPSQFNVYGVEINPAYPALGVLWIASMLESAGHSVEIIDMDADGETIDGVVKRFRDGGFDILGLTATTPTYQNALNIARAVKLEGPHAKTMLGGIHATIDAMACIRENAFDFVVVGEAECTVVELVDGMMVGLDDFSAIKGIVYRAGEGEIVSSGARSLIPDLDDFPMPAHHLVNNLQKYAPADAEVLPAAPIMVSRGCPGQCTFCLTKNIFGRRTRFRSPENVLEEVRSLVYRHNIKEIHFLDDVITANKKFVREFCQLLIAEPYKLRLQVANGLRADMVNEEILTLLRDAGLTNVGFGIESGNDGILKTIKKGISKERVLRAVKLAKSLGLETWGFFMMGLPGDDEESIEETIQFAIDLDVKYAKFLILKPFPGSEVYFQLDEKGLVDSRDFSMYGVYTPPVHHLENLTQERILALQQHAFRRFYFRPKKIWEHLTGVNSMAKFRSLVKGAYFVTVRSLRNQAAGIGVNTGG